MAGSHPGLQKIGRYWHYSLKINGERIHGSTRSSDLTTARMVLEEKRRELINGQHHRPTRLLTVRELSKEWLRSHQATFSKGHLASAECALRKWVFPEVGGLPVARLTTQEVLKVQSMMLEKGCSGTYANNTLRTLKAIFNFGIRTNYLTRMPFAVSRLSVQKKPRAIIPAVRVREFLSTLTRTCRNPHVPVIVGVMLGLGLREGEALGMRWEWFNPEGRTYTVGKTKTRESRVLPVPDWLWGEIHSMPKTLSGWVFPAEDGKPHRAQFSKKAIQRVCKTMGLGNITPHRLRASYATLHATEAGTPITEIQGLLGHRSVTTTMIYVEQSMANKRKAQDALSKQLGLA